MDIYKMDMEKDPLFRGEFDVVKQLLNERPEMTAAKKRVISSRWLSWSWSWSLAVLNNVRDLDLLISCRLTSWSTSAALPRLVELASSSSGWLEILSLFNWAGSPLTFRLGWRSSHFSISNWKLSERTLPSPNWATRSWTTQVTNNSFQNWQNGSEIGWTFKDQSFFQLKLSWRPRSKTTSQNTSCSLSSAPILGRWTILF